MLAPTTFTLNFYLKPLYSNYNLQKNPQNPLTKQNNTANIRLLISKTI